jgi:putative FmdB family regulatory protein
LPQNHRFEIQQSIREDPLTTCPECGGEVRRVIHPAGIVFKGSGFYATDSRKSTSDSKPKPTTAGESGKEQAAPAKTDAKSESAGANQN